MVEEEVVVDTDMDEERWNRDGAVKRADGGMEPVLPVSVTDWGWDCVEVSVLWSWWWW